MSPTCHVGGIEIRWRSSRKCQTKGARGVLVEGVLREDELAEATGFRLPEGPYETLAGFLMARLGHIPVVGETVQEHGWEFTVVEVDRRRVEQVRVTMPEPTGD